jgi:hypothetical protein
MRNHVLLATVCAAAITIAVPHTRAAAFDDSNVSTATDPGFTPDSGQINRGYDQKNPSSSETRPIPTPAEARAAMIMPTNDQPALAPQGANANANATTGSGTPAAAPAGPIGATAQTMPAKLSRRNDILDRLPIMALPQPLSDQDRKHIYQAVMADKTPAASGAETLSPASRLTTSQALNETHPLPASVSVLGGTQSLAYVKSKSKVFLVKPNTRIVVEEIGM